jgi:UPF0716 protein FxsA
MAASIDDRNLGANKARAGISLMSLVKWAIIGLVMLPAAEVLAFLLVAALIGWIWAIILFFATSAAGIMLLRRTARGDFERLRAAVASEGLRGLHLETPGAASMLGGILLACPGFITDVLGAMLFVPGARRWLRTRLALAARRREEARRDPRIIDLEPSEWQQISDGRRNGRAKSRGGTSARSTASRAASSRTATNGRV